MSKTLYKSFNITVKGKVQGVWFRKSTLEQARRLGIQGWVKNCDNGDVEILAQGKEESLEQLLNWCKIGPKRAIVQEVEVHEVEHGQFQGFTIR